MAIKRVTAELAIKAIDQYSGQIGKMGRVTGRFADKVRADLGRLQKLRGPLRLIEDFKKLHAENQKTTGALDAARKNLRDLGRDLMSVSRPTDEMRKKYQAARREVTRLERAADRSVKALETSRRALKGAGIDASNLASEQRRLSAAVDAATPAFDRQVERLKRLEAMRERIAQGRAQMDRSLATAANLSFVGNASAQTGRRMLSGLSGPVKQAIEFESAMSDVKKVVDFDSPESFRQMSDDILELSTRVPMSTSAIAMLAATGGQLGVAREDLMEFSLTAAKIGIAFDISAETAAGSLGKIQTAMGLSLDRASVLFDAMNHVSNNTAARADQTLEFVNRAGAAGAGFGFDPKETLAFGAAMIAAGAGADTAATSFQNMGRALTRGDSATKRQSAAMKRLGLNSRQVAKDMQKDAVGTTMDVLKRLRELPEHLRASTMSDLFGDEARELTKLINNAQLLPDVLAMVADETQYLGSADKEYAARSATTANNIQLLRNQLTRLGISVGEVVLPPLNDLLDRSQVVIDRIVEWTKAHPKLTKWLVIGAAAVAGLAVAGGGLMTAAAGLIGTMAVLRFGMVGLGARAVFATGSLLGVGKAFGGLTSLAPFALSGMLRPVKWGAKLIGRIPWVRLAGRLALGSLLFPFRWTSRFIPKIGWAKFVGRLALNSLVAPLKWTGRILPNFAPALARFRNFRIAATAQMTRLMAAVNWRLLALGGVAAGVFAALYPNQVNTGPNGETENELVKSEQETYWSKSPKERQELVARDAAVAKADQALEGAKPKNLLESIGWMTGPPSSEPKVPYVSNSGGPSQRNGIRGFHRLAPAESLRPKARATEAERELKALEGKVAALERINALTSEGPLPTTDRLAELREEVAAYQADVEAARQALDAAPTFGSGVVNPDGQRAQADLNAARIGLQQAQQELAKAEAASDQLSAALAVVNDVEVAPAINTASVERAIALVEQLAAKIANMPTANAGVSGAPKPAGKRARGGPVFGGLPYLVNEETPRSELFVPSQSGGILNVSQAQSVLRSHLASGRSRMSSFTSGADRLRRTSMAALSSVAVAMPVSAPAQGGPSGPREVHISIGSVTIPVPPGVTDAESIAQMTAQYLSEQVSGALEADFSD